MFDDPFGHRWNIATHIEDVSPEQRSNARPRP
jgi:PhnB protein